MKFESMSDGLETYLTVFSAHYIPILIACVGRAVNQGLDERKVQDWFADFAHSDKPEKYFVGDEYASLERVVGDMLEYVGTENVELP